MNKKYICLYFILICFIGILYWMGCHQPIEHYIDISHLGGKDTDLTPFHNNDDYDLQRQRFYHNKCCLGKKHLDKQHNYNIELGEDQTQSYLGNLNIDPSVSYINPDDIFIDEKSSHQNCCSMMHYELDQEHDSRPDTLPEEENVIIDITLDDSLPETSPETLPETSPETLPNKKEEEEE